jgi:hypothetical protein
MLKIAKRFDRYGRPGRRSVWHLASAALRTNFILALGLLYPPVKNQLVVFGIDHTPQI